MMFDSIAVIDFGSQYSQLITRRVREAHVYCALFPWDAPTEMIIALHPKGFILSGSPSSVYEKNAPRIPDFLLESKLPIMGLCYGMHIMAYALGGTVSASTDREYGPAELEIINENPISHPGFQRVWMSHGDRIESLPPGFVTLGRSDNSPIAFMGDLSRGYFGLQFHPEVQHTPGGREMLHRFVIDVCHAEPGWNPESIITESVSRIQKQVGEHRVLSAVSGGVDSSVATAMVKRAVGDQLAAVFVDTGLLRQGEAELVKNIFREKLDIELVALDAKDRFMKALKGVTAPEEKRRIIGELFIRTFERQARKMGNPRFLVQGTIYPDVVESSAPERRKAHRIKTHHNVGGLPENMKFELVEPLRYLFKDEVRAVGEALGLPHELVRRQPFPGPGLAVRCLGEITSERLVRLRAADFIFTNELSLAGLLDFHTETGTEEAYGTAQAFAVLLPVQSVGVMGDQRTYQEVIALRAVATEDFMTADWARLPHDLLARIANRIVNEVEGINRVVYDITSKPPATIEWE
jgi:GMP synthase (glutamine-hydrolysing)